MRYSFNLKMFVKVGSHYSATEPVEAHLSNGAGFHLSLHRNRPTGPTRISSTKLADAHLATDCEK
jgi:hypothetical protein